MGDAVRHTKQKLPVLIIIRNRHVMAEAEIFKTPEKVLIQIITDGNENQLLAEFLEQAEPIALSFGAVPAQNIREKRETN